MVETWENTLLSENEIRVMFRATVALIFLIVNLTLFGCSSATGGLQGYTNSTEGYKFLYPNGWQEVKVDNNTAGVDVVFRDLVEQTENVSVVINEVGEERKLQDLGTPSEVGQRLKNTIAPPDSERQGELIRADELEKEGKTYYLLEYKVTFPDNRERHNMASVAVSRGKLFTFSVSTPQNRWDSLSERFNTIADSFEVY
jgi:photosystem II oxygen-evolving enhancer protein 2